MKVSLLSATCLVGLLAVAPVIAGGNTDAGKIKAQNCLGCHGGKEVHSLYPTYNVPRIGGQHEGYILKSLKAYADGSRKHATMGPQAESLSDQDMADLAAYFASR